jgi:SAM-dependent methyltransferase
MTPHSPAWYKQLAKVQQGYYYPWKSVVSPFNGEDAYLELVKAHLQPHLEVLDAGCGHGDVALDIAPLCHSVLAYDLVEDYIKLAQREIQKRSLKNIKFICADSSARANNGSPRLPAKDKSIDLFISRRGPLHWLEDVKRVAKPNATIIMLNPLETPAPAWHELLPKGLSFPFPTSGTILAEVQRRLNMSGLELHSYWIFDVPEIFGEVQELYKFLTWNNFASTIPAFEEVKPILELVFKTCGDHENLVIRNRRLLWKTVVN